MDTIPVELTLHETSLLLTLVSERIIDSDAQGIPREHASSVFRETLLRKLIAAKQAWLDARATQKEP